MYHQIKANLNAMIARTEETDQDSDDKIIGRINKYTDERYGSVISRPYFAQTSCLLFLSNLRTLKEVPVSVTPISFAVSILQWDRLQQLDQ